MCGFDSRRACALVCALALVACDDTDDEVDAGTGTDAGMDAGPSSDDGGIPPDEDGGEDAGPPSPDGGPLSPASEQIEAVLVAPAGAADLPIEGALVSYVRPEIGEQPAGFFLQAQRTGPAIFVGIDPDSLTPPAEVGQRVELRATDLTDIETNQGRREIVGLEGWTVVSTGEDVSTFVQDVSSIDVVAAAPDYAMELIAVRFQIRGSYRVAGGGFSQISIDTAALEGSDSITLRVPDSLVAPLDLEPNCEYMLTGTPLWTVGEAVQLTVFDAAEVSQGSCDPPLPNVADALNERTIVVRFTRPLDTASVLASGAQFTVTHSKFGTIPVTAAVAGDTYAVITTSTDLLPGQFYALRTAATVLDTLGVGVPAAMSTTMLEGYTPHLVVNEVDYDQGGTDDAEYVEIHNPSMSAMPLTGVTLYTIAVTAGAGSVQAMVDLVPNSAAITELPPGGFLVVTTASSSALVVSGEAPVVSLGASLADEVAGLIIASTAMCHDSVFYEGVALTPATLLGCMYPSSAGTDAGEGVTSLARIPNASDFDENSLDFLREAPTVGTANVP